MKILSVVGARPNFVKIAPIARALAGAGGFGHVLVHTGQHYAAALSDAFFDDLEIPRPDVELGIGSASHGAQTGRMLEALETVLLAERPDRVLVVGDVNSTLAAALAAVKLGIPVDHVEAGLRSGDRAMPEEINRVLVDQIADLLFTTSPDADANLRREGIDPDRIHRVGNVMIDSLARWREPARARRFWERLEVEDGAFGLVTLHRPRNVDDRDRLAAALDRLAEVAGRLPLVYPVHPRTAARLAEFGLEAARPGLIPIEPVGYLDFLSLLTAARLVVTDSGGVQEETTWLGVPCLTLRPNTERPVTVTAGTNRLVALDDLVEAVDRALAAPPSGPERRPALWDGQAAGRIVDILVSLRSAS